MSILHNLVNQFELGKLVLQSGQGLFQLGDTVSRMHVVTKGEVVLERYSASGVRLILQRARAGDIIASHRFLRKAIIAALRRFLL